MTIYYPDVSNHQGEMTLQAGTTAVCAKASEGATYADPTFLHYQQEADRVGAVFFGYHFLRQGAGAAQAAWCFKLVGRGVNVMIDLEPVKNATGGYISKPTLADALAFATAYRAAGGLCTLIYLPRWYWQALGSPDLAPLRSAGLSLVSSNYTIYADTGPGWAPYGANAPTPAVWQYTETQPYSGRRVDFNAYRGSVSQFKALLGYTQAPAPAPAPSIEEDEMSTTSVNGRAGLSWAAGSRHVVQVTYDPAGGDPVLRVVLALTTGPLVLPTWTLAKGSGSGVVQIPAQHLATCRGVILEGAPGIVYDATAA